MALECGALVGAAGGWSNARSCGRRRRRRALESHAAAVPSRLPPRADLLPAFASHQLRSLGLGHRWLAAALSAGEVVEVVRGAYLPSALLGEPLAVAQAAALVLPPHVVACRGLAAMIHGVDPRGPSLDDRPVAVQGLVPASNRTPKWMGASIYEAPLAAHDVVEVGGVLVTSPERTALDCARYLRPPMALAVLDRMARLGLVDREVLLLRIEEFRGDRWVGQARHLIAHVEPGAESYGESWFRLRLLDAGFPRPRVQIWVPEERPGAARLDLGWEEVRKAGECDGAEFHGPEQQDVDDARRDRLEREHGWRFLSVRKDAVLGRSTRLEEAFGELLGLAPKTRRRAW